MIIQKSAGPTKKAEDVAPGASESDPVPRGIRVNQDLLDKFGDSTRCPKCEALRRDDKEHKGHHSKECRKRIEER